MMLDELTAGNFRGVTDGGAAIWRGIRYARAPRFEPPQPVADPLTPQLCDRFGAACAQPPGTVADAASDADDTLFLNVYSPAADAKRRPVLVWIHGGAFSSGAGSQYDGRELAARGEIVVVTINYRLGALGFADLTAQGGTRNLGLLDQIAALRWVRDHIADFGGDPTQITIAGESAGSMSVALLLLAPAAAGLFHGAIMQSGALNLIDSAATGARLGQRYAQLLGVEHGGIEDLRQLSIAEILRAQRLLAAENQPGIAAAPIFDGELLPGSLTAAVAAKTAPVPLLAGSNREEIRFFELPGARSTLPMTRPAITAALQRGLGEQQTAQILAAYADDRTGNRALGTDANFAVPTRNFAARHADAGNPTFVYRFDYGGPLLGAAHAIDLTYLWPSPGPSWSALRGGPLRGARSRLANRLRAQWITFVREGRPEPDWPAFDTTDRAIKIFDHVDRIEHDPKPERRRAWDGRDVLMCDSEPLG